MEHALARSSSFGVTGSDSAGVQQPLGRSVALSLVRQIAFELDETLRAQGTSLGLTYERAICPSRVDTDSMRQLAANPQINRYTLLQARCLNGQITQRELARRAAERLGAPNRDGALQQSLSRIERGHAVGLEREAVDALAAELGLRGGVDLTEPYQWVYRNTCSHWAGKTGDPITWLGDRLPAFTCAANAFEARGWVTFAEGRVIPVLAYSHPYEVFYTELMAELGDDESRMVLDPDYEEFCELAGTT